MTGGHIQVFPPRQEHALVDAPSTAPVKARTPDKLPCGPGRQSEPLWSCPVSSFHGWRSWPPMGKFGSSAQWGRAVWAVRRPACPGRSWGVFKVLFGEKESPDVRTLPKDQAKPSGKSCPFVSGEQGAPVPPHSRHWPTADVGWRGGMAIRNSEVEPTWQH